MLPKFQVVFKIHANVRRVWAVYLDRRSRRVGLSLVFVVDKVIYYVAELLQMRANIFLLKSFTNLIRILGLIAKENVG